MRDWAGGAPCDGAPWPQRFGEREGALAAVGQPTARHLSTHYTLSFVCPAKGHNTWDSHMRNTSPDPTVVDVPSRGCPIRDSIGMKSGDFFLLVSFHQIIFLKEIEIHSKYNFGVQIGKVREGQKTLVAFFCVFLRFLRFFLRRFGFFAFFLLTFLVLLSKYFVEKFTIFFFNFYFLYWHYCLQQNTCILRRLAVLVLSLDQNLVFWLIFASKNQHFIQKFKY